MIFTTRNLDGCKRYAAQYMGDVYSLGGKRMQDLEQERLFRDQLKKHGSVFVYGRIWVTLDQLRGSEADFKASLSSEIRNLSDDMEYLVSEAREMVLQDEELVQQEKPAQPRYYHEEERRPQVIKYEAVDR